MSDPLTIFGIHPDDLCPKCSGMGRRTYSSTAAWGSGIGGSTMTQALCDSCWGSGEKRPYTNQQAREIVLKETERERDALAKFKTYVHDRLDAAGIPTHPDGPHSKEGCRVGDRFDLLVARLAAAELLVGYVTDGNPYQHTKGTPLRKAVENWISTRT